MHDLYIIYNYHYRTIVRSTTSYVIEYCRMMTNVRWKEKASLL